MDLRKPRTPRAQAKGRELGALTAVAASAVDRFPSNGHGGAIAGAIALAAEHDPGENFVGLGARSAMLRGSPLCRRRLVQRTVRSELCSGIASRKGARSPNLRRGRTFRGLGSGAAGPARLSRALANQTSWLCATRAINSSTFDKNCFRTEDLLALL